MLKVGDYIRTKSGIIRKIETVKSGKRKFTRTTETLINGKFKLNDIVKHSKNIIDLIEEDDWINGQHVKEVKDGYAMVGNGIDGFMIWGRNIQRIVTKEQFANIEYKLNT